MAEIVTANEKSDQFPILIEVNFLAGSDTRDHLDSLVIDLAKYWLVGLKWCFCQMIKKLFKYLQRSVAWLTNVEAGSRGVELSSASAESDDIWVVHLQDV